MPSFNPKRALLSVSDKSGLVELAKALHEKQVELVATGNTAKVLREAHLPVTEVSDCTGFPEMMDGRVKTLHPAIHAGLLARGTQDEQALKEQSIQAFDLLVVNLYPFEKVTNNEQCHFSDAIENIDIGGSAMIRAAAKNHANVLVVVTPADYQSVIDCLYNEALTDDWRFSLAQKAFAHTAAYDAAISNYFNKLNSDKKSAEFPNVLSCQFHKKYDLRYGENPHQKAAFYINKNPQIGSLAMAEIVQGKALSYNNLLDADAAFDCIRSFSPANPTCVIVKHGNPCGIAMAKTSLQAYLRAFQSDPISAYGGILAFNQCVDEETIKTLLEKQFAEVIIAPEITRGAKEILQSKPNVRVLITGQFPEQSNVTLDMRNVNGGVLVQEHDAFQLNHDDFKVVTLKVPTTEQKQDLLFAWQAVKHVKSNAIVLAKNAATLGIGAGQTNRVMSTRIALWQAELAGFPCDGAVMASDAFIPFADSLELAAQAGISAIIQPGGSIRDAQIIDVANAAGISMIFTAIRHFKH